MKKFLVLLLLGALFGLCLIPFVQAQSLYLADVGKVDAGTPYDISDLSYLAYATSTESNHMGIAFKADGTRMWSIGYGTDTVVEYNLSTAWDITSITPTGSTLSVASEDNVPTGLVVIPDGSKLFIIGTQHDTAYQYTLSTPNSLAGASYASKSCAIGTQDTNPAGITFSSDGSKMYAAGRANSKIFQYTLGGAYDFATCNYATKYVAASPSAATYGVTISPDDTAFYLTGSDGSHITVYQFLMSTAGDASTASYASKLLDVSAQNNTNMANGVWGDSGRKFYIPALTNFYEYSME